MKNYGPGRQVKTIKAFDKVLEAETLLFVPGWQRTCHPIILANMQYRTVKMLIKLGRIFIAKRIRKGVQK
jgi:hypothetical protein